MNPTIKFGNSFWILRKLASVFLDIEEGNVLQVVSAIGVLLQSMLFGKFEEFWGCHLVLFSGHLLGSFSPRRAQLVYVVTIETAPRGWKCVLVLFGFMALVHFDARCIKNMPSLSKTKIKCRLKSFITFYQISFHSQGIDLFEVICSSTILTYCGNNLSYEG